MTDVQLEELARELLREMSFLWSVGHGGEPPRLQSRPEFVVCAKGFLARAVVMATEKEER